jgi:F420-dependent oxidoreductase-like protein
MLNGMRIGLGIRVDQGLDGILSDVRAAEQAGFQSVWLANIFGVDALTALALAGRETSRIELGTAVVPTHSRHPLYMAQQALTVQAATGGRLALGIGPSHKVVIETLLGLSYARPARHVREYVEILHSLAHQGKVAHQGDQYRVQGQLQVPDARPFPILVGGLGERMRRIAGSLADGTITWMVGKRTLRDVLIPDVNAAAVSAGRTAPRIVASFPIAVCDGDTAAARETISSALAIYGQLPSYRAMLDLEGAARPGDVALVGSESEIERELAELAMAGVTDLLANPIPVGADPRASARRSHALLAELARR